MRAAIYCGPRCIELAERPDPVVAAPTDAVVPVTPAQRHAGKAGDDLGGFLRGRPLRAIVERADGRLVPRHPGEARGSDPGRGIEEDVTFVDGDHDVEDALDAAYRDRTKEEVASDLPPNQHSLISCTLTREQAGLYRRYVDRESRRGTAAGLRALKQRPRADPENPPYARAASVRRPWM
jgi:hypothetical protein